MRPSFVLRRQPDSLHPARWFTTFAVAILVLTSPRQAWPQTSAPAQPAAPPTPASPAPPSAQVTGGYQNGFFIQSTDGLNRLQIGVIVQADGRFPFEESPNEALTGTFAIRRLRPYLRGRVADHFEFYINPDFAGGTLVVQDAYFDTRFSNAFRLRFGKGKTPFGHERLHSAQNILFLERGFPTSIAPNRDLGVQILGDLAGGAVSYRAGVMNGVPDGANADVDTNDAKDVSGRIAVRPWIKKSAARLGGLGFALAGNRGKQTGAAALPVYRTNFQMFFSYSGAVADGTRTRYSPAAFYYYKAFGAFWEYVHSELPVAKGAIREGIDHQAWQIAGSYVLTGEAATEAGVRPHNNFDFGHGHLGAFQVAARYHELSVDRAAIDLGLAAAGASRQASAWTLGLNWYLNPNIKYVFNFDRAVFDDDPDGPRKPENVFSFRTQLYF